MNSEKNRNKRRDKKIAKKKTGMRVDDSGRRLALIKRALLWSGVPSEDLYKRRARED